MTRLLSWYGDDFTGSTDALEALASNGVRSILFLGQPDDLALKQFSDCEAFGIAGVSRSQTPEWMDANLPPVFEWMQRLGTALCHYKVCSTFDSSPEIGNIGRAIETGKRVLNTGCVPVLVGAPSLRRYVVFGNLFATAEGQTWRIDRHPTMSRHPVTPMHEADLTLHLSEQTRLPTASFNLLDLRAEDADDRFNQLCSQTPIVVLDTLDDDSLLRAGALLWGGRSQRPFVAGSSGVEYALIQRWRRAGLILPEPTKPAVPAADRVLVVSGSCSPVTAGQIGAASQSGFVSVRLDARMLAENHDQSAAVNAATAALRQGQSVVMFTAAGPSDAVTFQGSSQNGSDFRLRLAEQTGRILCDVLDGTGVQRIVVAGGDTSSYAGKQLEIGALTYVASLAPGAPLCRAWSRRPDRNGLEVVFKGGQCGADDFFSFVKTGRQV